MLSLGKLYWLNKQGPNGFETHWSFGSMICLPTLSERILNDLHFSGINTEAYRSLLQPKGHPNGLVWTVSKDQIHLYSNFFNSPEYICQLEDVPELEILPPLLPPPPLHNPPFFHSAMERHPSLSSQSYHGISSNLEKSQEDQTNEKSNSKYWCYGRSFNKAT